MRTKIMLLLFLQITSLVYGQDKIFSLLATYQGEQQVKQLSDSINKPLLVTKEKIYVIGSDCLTRLFDGNINDRKDDGNNDDRNNGGNADKREKGGGIGDRKRKAKNNNRNNDGDIDERNNGAGSDNRDAGGDIADGPKCSYTKSGKILLYTRQNIKSSEAKIYLNNRYFLNKYFKIIKL